MKIRLWNDTDHVDMWLLLAKKGCSDEHKENCPIH